MHGASASPLWQAAGTVGNVYGPDGLGATVTSTATRYVVADHLGTTRALLDFDRYVVETYMYGGYGETADVYQGGTVRPMPTRLSAF